MSLKAILRRITHTVQTGSLRLTYQALPTPLEMLADSSPEKTYRGWKVAWHLTLKTMSRDLDDSIVNVLAHQGHNSPDIWLAVPIAANPDVFRHGSGTKFAVKAEVRQIQSGCIYLDNCLLDFAPTPGT